MSQLLVLPFVPAFTVGGLIAPGALLKAYVSGTSTPTPLYTSADQLVEHTWPVVADASGRFDPIYLNEEITYRFVLETAEGVQIGEEVDPYYSTSNALGARLDTAETDIDALQVASTLAVLGTAITVKKDTQANLYADLAHDDDTLAIVYADATPENNDIYVKSGASGAGSWSDPLGIFATYTQSLAGDAADSADIAVAAAASIATTKTEAIGVIGLAPTTIANFSANKLIPLWQAPYACTITSFGLGIQTLNSGPVRIERATGSDVSALTLAGSPEDLTPAGTGAQTFTGLSFEMAEGDWLMLHLPSGGPAAQQADFLGNTLAYVNADAASGTVNASSTIANKTINWTASYEYSATQVARTGLADEQLLNGLSATAVASYRDIGLGSSVAGTTNASLSRIYEIASNDTDFAAEVLEVGVYVATAGSTALKLLTATRPGTVTFTSPAFALPVFTGTGEKVFTKADDDFAGIYLDPGEKLWLYVDATAPVLTFEPVANSTLYYRTSLSVVTAGATVTELAGQEMRTRVRLAAGKVAISEADLSDEVAAAIGPLIRPSTPAPILWDLIMGVGQSNMEGRGDSTLSDNVASGAAKLWDNVSAFSDLLRDPVGGATSGSMIPSFVNRYYQRTGRGVLYVEQSTGGTAILSGTPNWGPSGTLRGAAVTAYEAAYAAAQTAGYAVRKAGILFCQGESDGDAGETQAAYYAALGTLFDYFEAQLGFGTNCLPIIIAQTGRLTASDTYGDIRAAQAQMVRARPNVHFGHFGAVNFVTRSLMNGDGVHWTQAALNEVGEAMADVASVVA